MGKDGASRKEGESQGAEGERRYPQRDRKKPEWHKDYVEGVGYKETQVDYCYRVAFVPRCYEEAVHSEDCREWKEAMDAEMSSLVENNVFDVVEKPCDKNVIGGRWVYATKSDQDGNVKYKARFVAKGYSQKEDVDYFETFSPTAHLTSVRMLMQKCVDEDMVVHQMDVKTAYLNAEIDTELYMSQPEGYTECDVNGQQKVWRLNKSLYGLKQSGRNWNQVLREFLVHEGFVQSQTDQCLFVRHDDEGCVYILFWVDDIIVAASDDVLMTQVKASLSARFRMKDLGILKWFLGIEFQHTEGKITMSQKQYVEKVLDRFDMSQCNSKTAPCDEGVVKDVDDSPLLQDVRPYRELVGSLVYMMVGTRPDLSYSVTKLSQKLANPTERDMCIAKGVLRYLRGTADYSLSFVRSTHDANDLKAYCDSDWGSNVEDRKSISGYTFLFNESGFVSWKTKKQQTVALSSCEAEYMALGLCVQESLFLRNLLNDLQMEITNDCVQIGVDNQGAIALAKNPVARQRSKHIDIRYHFIRECIKENQVSLYYVSTQNNLADVLTKPVSGKRIRRLFKL